VTSSSLAGRRLPNAVLGVAALWLVLAVLAGTTGFLVRLPFPGPQLLFATLFVATLVSATMVPAVRDWVDALPLRALIGINATRFIGITFLVLAARGEIAPVFANRAGWGDIATATLAIVLLLAGDPRTASQRALVHAWNVFGFLDLVVAVGTATWVTLNGITPGVQPVLSWPLSVVPLFFVPVFLTSHVLIARRLLAR
jgi:hypothetical protein